VHAGRPLPPVGPIRRRKGRRSPSTARATSSLTPAAAAAAGRRPVARPGAPPTAGTRGRGAPARSCQQDPRLCTPPAPLFRFSPTRILAFSRGDHHQLPSLLPKPHLTETPPSLALRTLPIQSSPRSGWWSTSAFGEGPPAPAPSSKGPTASPAPVAPPPPIPTAVVRVQPPRPCLKEGGGRLMVGVRVATHPAVGIPHPWAFHPAVELAGHSPPIPQPPTTFRS